MTDVERIKTIVDSLVSEMNTEHSHDHGDANCDTCKRRDLLMQTHAVNMCNTAVAIVVNTGILVPAIFMSCLVIGMEIGIAFEQSKQMEIFDLKGETK
jgi:hypothetical protein